MLRTDAVKRLIAEHNRHLQKLKEQQAKLGLHTPPHILTEIEDIEGKIERLQIELEDLAALPIEIDQESEKICHNLPQPDYERFVGRKTELNQIRQLLSPYPNSRHFVITIDGIGGIGKSALALEVANRYRLHYDKLPEKERFEAIVWTTAKQTLLTGEGIFTRSQTLRTLDDIYTTIAVTLQREDITRAHPNEQDNLVRHALTQQRTLIIIDNLETVDDDRVISFIRELPDPTKVIVTTRHRLDVAYPVRVLGMTEGEGLELIADEAKLKSVDLTKNEAKQLFKRTGGVPLAIVWSVAQMGFGYGVEAVLARLGKPTGDIARFCFEATLGRIQGKPAHKLLMALSLFATDANREALSYVAELPILDCDDGLVELEKLSLVNKHRGRFSMLPLTKSYSLHELEINESFAKNATKRWVTQLTGLLDKQTGQYWIRDQEAILREGENFCSVLDWAIIQNDYEAALKVIQPSVTYLKDAGRRGEALKRASQGMELAKQAGNISIYAWLCVNSGWILSQQGTHTEAIELTKIGLQEYQRLPDNNGECFAKCFLAQAFRHSGQLPETKKLLEEVVNESSKLKYREGLSMAKFELGKLARKQDNWDEAYTHFSIAYSTLSKLVDGKFTDIFSLSILGNYGTAALSLGKYVEAKEVTLQVLTILEEWQNVASSFNVRMRLQIAEIEKMLGNNIEALKHAEHALKLSRSKGNEKGVRQAEKFVETLQLS